MNNDPLRILENSIFKKQIETKYVSIMDNICSTMMAEGKFNDYYNEVDYDPIKEELYITTHIKPIGSLKTVTVEFNKDMFPNMSDDQFTDFVNGLKEEIENYSEDNNGN